MTCCSFSGSRLRACYLSGDGSECEWSKAIPKQQLDVVEPTALDEFRQEVQITVVLVFGVVVANQYQLPGTGGWMAACLQCAQGVVHRRTPSVSTLLEPMRIETVSECSWSDSDVHIDMHPDLFLVEYT